MYQFCSGACGCGLISETQEVSIAFDYSYSVMTLGGSPPNIGHKCLLLVWSCCKMRSLKFGVK